MTEVHHEDLFEVLSRTASVNFWLVLYFKSILKKFICVRNCIMIGISTKIAIQTEISEVGPSGFFSGWLKIFCGNVHLFGYARFGA